MSKRKDFLKQNHDEHIISSLIFTIVQNIPEVSSLNSEKKRDIKLYFAGDKVYIDVNIAVQHNINVPETAYTLQSKIRKGVETNTQCHVEKVNINVISVILPA